MIIVALVYGTGLGFWHRKLMVQLHASHPDEWQRLGREDITDRFWPLSLRLPIWSWGSQFFFVARRYERLGLPEFSRQAARFRFAYSGRLLFLLVATIVAFWVQSHQRPNQVLQPAALWRCASMSFLITVASTVAQPRSQSGG